MSTTGKEYEMLIKIAGTVDSSVETSLTKIQRELKQMQSKYAESQDKLAKITMPTWSECYDAFAEQFTKLDKGFDKIVQIGKTTFEAVAKAAGVAAVAVGAIVYESYNVGSEFETAFSGVKKTVDATEEEFASLRQGIIDLSTEIPSTAEEIAGVMEIAGQLGISNDSLLEFTKTMINLGVSTNMTAEDAATSLARFANIVSMKGFAEDGTSNWERLGSTIVALGNNFATTEAEIVEMSYKLASTGDIVGLSESDILALATAMSAVGIKAEAGGSAMAKMLKKLQLAVETNSDSLADYARVAGMTGDEFKEVFQKDAVKAFAAFTKGINNTERNGKSAVAVLNDLGISEIRMSNMLLALSSAEGVLDNALELSNDAWGESNALQEEASKRYETVESKMSILKNTLTETGIAIYDQIRTPAVNVLEIITEKIQSVTAYVKGPNGVSKWIVNISDALYQSQRKVKKYGGAILDFLEPVLNVGKWFLKNPDVIISALAGIGAALASYKIASETVKITNAVIQFVTKANVYVWAITAITAAIGVVIGAYTSLKFKEQELVDNALAEHFGSISLSMQDVQNIAKKLVDPSGALSVLSDVLDDIGNVQNITKAIDDLEAEFNKADWKISIGLDIDSDGYKANIDQYIQLSKDYIAEQKYAVEMAASLFIPNYSESDTKAKLEEYYYYAEDSMEQFGKQLANAVNSAFSDGLLDVSEAEEIAQIRQHMGELQANIAAGTYEASMKALELSSYGDLTPETFKALAEEAQSISDKAAEDYTQAFTTTYSAFKAAGLDTTEIEQEYQKKLLELRMNSTQWLIDVLKDKFGEELDWLPEFYEKTASGYNDEYYWMAKSTDVTSDPLEEYLNGIALRLAVQQPIVSKEVASFLDVLKPQSEDMQAVYDSYKRLGGEAISGVDAALEDLVNILALGGDEDALREKVMHYMLANIPANIPGSGNNGLGEDGSASGKFDIPLGGHSSGGHSFDSHTSGGHSFDLSVTPHAVGGMFTTPHLGLVAEAGPESIIPLNGSSRAISLWEKTGRLLGMSGRFDNLDFSGDSGSSTITYSPTLQFYGDAPSKDDLTDALRMSQDEFDMMMERYMKRNRRVSFA